MKRKILKNIEWSILISTIILVIIGLVALTSATKNSNYEELKKQILWLTISIPILIVVIFVDYDIFAKNARTFLSYSSENGMIGKTGGGDSCRTPEERRTSIARYALRYGKQSCL